MLTTFGRLPIGGTFKLFNGDCQILPVWRKLTTFGAAFIQDKSDKPEFLVIHDCQPVIADRVEMSELARQSVRNDATAYAERGY